MEKDSKQSTQQTYSTRRTLIERVKDQYNEEAWNEFSDIYTRYIYAIIRNMGISPQDSEEIHQQVMVKLWKKVPELDFDEIRRFRSYLGVIVKNEVRQFIRARTRLLERESKAANDVSLEYLKNIRLPDIERIAEKEWQVHLANIALHKIEPYFSPNAILLFRLCLEGAKPEEITEKTGIARNSINTIKARVRSRLSAEIKRLQDDLQ
jgi:RNA polymerase sigma factor (sigma-70 family)